MPKKIKVTAAQLYDTLVNKYNIIGQKGNITFKLKDFSILINSRDSVGNILQEWLTSWMTAQNYEFEKGTNSQTFPDIHLNVSDKTKNLLEIKVFDFDRGPGFDLANFDAYCNSLQTNAYRVDADYLIIAYTMTEEEITINNIWLKKIWEIAGASSTFPLKVQEKKNIIYNIRPIIWYSERNKFKPFNNVSEFLVALNETRYQYPPTKAGNAHWLRKVLSNYEASTGIKLEVK